MFLKNLQRDWKRNKCIYLMAIPVILFYAVFCYMPMAGIVIAFQDFEHPEKHATFERWFDSIRVPGPDHFGASDQ